MTVHVPVPVHLAEPVPLHESEPVRGCGVCTALGKQRAEAAARGDHSRATDCTVEIRNHPHAREGATHERRDA
ncbi:hypothetical protein [Streptomyces sp. MUM 178J]|uniref:hypothetical protein n=1 Tax=Streptomyces sp. MUM 178J TaxID=2791991 RepID=UPI001F048F8E|nr:hypothetical protein [Streptomyces sp. MUM 178J]WRQ81483.1 hypothetical protein I3F59_020205 [Streptomyces sp. MUM 178J]